ncbi:TRAUB-domain-containing protein [Testicularia cyperi]|uniref:Protein BFR2 n=1 Tax=Testicularia cyperi TaxID=1882483 RepID=A0A317XIR5_9BASI|nr:TRAUB-domain-containing protein [Testicularia cyperi]
MPPKRSSLASLMGTLTSAAPVDFDPEAIDAHTLGADDHSSSSEPEDNHQIHSDNDDDEDEEKEYLNPTAHYADVGPSQMRKKAALSESQRLQDAKYHGVKSTRAELYGDSQDESGNDDDDDDDDALSNDEEIDDDDDDEEITSEDDDDDEESSDGAQSDASASQRNGKSKSTKKLRFANDDDDEDPVASTSNSIAAQMAQSASQAKALKAKRLEDAEKGRQVRKQIRTYDRILEGRIKAQSLLREVNKLPDPAVYGAAMSGARDGSQVEPVVRVLERLLELSETLFGLRGRLDTLNGSEEQNRDAVSLPETRKRKRDFDVSLPTDDDQDQDQHKDAMAETWNEIRTHVQISAHVDDVISYSQQSEAHRRSVLDKWSLKVTSAASAAANANRFQSLKAVNQPPSVQIDNALAGDGLSRLVSRTRVLRGEGEAVAKLSSSTATLAGDDAEVFDDSDFYSHLLKELIDRRSGSTDVLASGTTHAFMSGKKKRAVDTRASKGRKLRYDVNDKLVNFMPPMSDRLGWTDGQIDRLFRQLAASGLDSHDAHDDDDHDAVANTLLDADNDDDDDRHTHNVADLGGLRVFG